MKQDSSTGHQDLEQLCLLEGPPSTGEAQAPLETGHLHKRLLSCGKESSLPKRTRAAFLRVGLCSASESTVSQAICFKDFLLGFWPH